MTQYTPTERDGRVRAALMAQKTGSGVPIYAKYLKAKDGQEFHMFDDARAALALAELKADSVGYVNPWSTGPTRYYPENDGVTYKGLSIFRRGPGFDVVASGVAISTRVTLRNCKAWIDQTGGFPRPAARGKRFTYHESAPGVFNVVTEYAGGYGSPEAIAKLKGDTLEEVFRP